jgi:hypothetical protein
MFSVMLMGSRTYPVQVNSVSNKIHRLHVAAFRSSTPPLLHRNLSQELIDESSAGSMSSLDTAVAVAAKNLAHPTLQLSPFDTSSSPPKHRRDGSSCTRSATESTHQPLLKRMASGVVGQTGLREPAVAQGVDAASSGSHGCDRAMAVAEAGAGAKAEACPAAAPPSGKPLREPHHRWAMGCGGMV